jgi:hypothetical protein
MIVHATDPVGDFPPGRWPAGDRERSGKEAAVFAGPCGTRRRAALKTVQKFLTKIGSTSGVRPGRATRQ